MLESLDIQNKNVLADKGYDTDRIVELIRSQNAVPVIPSKSNRLIPRDCDWWLYKERHLLECFFNKIKHYRRLATRYDKLLSSFLAFLTIASIILWLL
jgi:transposase